MPEHIGYLLETGTAPHHLCRRRMPEKMRRISLGDSNTRLYQASMNDVRDRRWRLQWLKRGVEAQKNSTVYRTWSGVLQIVDKCLTDILR